MTNSINQSSPAAGAGPGSGAGWLVLAREQGESIVISFPPEIGIEPIVIRVNEIRPVGVRLAFKAPKVARISRGELLTGGATPGLAVPDVTAPEAA